jgi:hypothetical protein
MFKSCIRFFKNIQECLKDYGESYFGLTLAGVAGLLEVNLFLFLGYVGLRKYSLDVRFLFFVNIFNLFRKYGLM